MDTNKQTTIEKHAYRFADLGLTIYDLPSQGRQILQTKVKEGAWVTIERRGNKWRVEASQRRELTTRVDVRSVQEAYGAAVFAIQTLRDTISR